MFMRLVHVKVRDGQIERLQQHYRQRIIAALSGISGCRYAGLMRSQHHSEECLSLTLWDSERDAEAYEGSGLFETLLNETRPYKGHEFPGQDAHGMAHARAGNISTLSLPNPGATRVGQPRKGPACLA